MKLFYSNFYGTLTVFANFFILNILWVITCLPIITFFPATSAMFSVIRRWKLKGDSGVLFLYIKYFKENFKQSFIIGTIWVIFSVILYFDFLFIRQFEFRVFLLVPLLFIALLFIFTTIYLFSTISHYNASIKVIIKSSFLVSMAYFPMTILNLILLALILVILYYFPIMSLILFSFAAFVNFSVCHKVFLKNGRLNEKKTIQQNIE
ncbi:hypothetical protein CIL05_00925 [Virgibacillus profundi]|uniref:DUF624 domain-containing protein n=1 Tax=Virgibacillus profundi TaxID=2024555 RepID=A0A2A2IJB8_9BACI|nr:hypothetical protein CIL05_00925 [Virgibacillus profundi]PXY55435.1 DUF624 domain-containing protein [Virgibacillus profundi]